MKREVKIGLFAVAMIGAAWAGIRFLSGFDIFSRNAVYYAAYDQVSGVQHASPIMMKGVKIGTVTGIAFDPSMSDKVVLQLTVQRRYRLPEDSEAKIFSNGLMGNKAIEIIYGASQAYLRSGDTLRAGRDRDLMDMAGSELDFFKQQFSKIATDLTATLENLNGLLERNAANIDGTLGNLNALSGDMASVLDAEKGHLRQAIADLSRFAGTLGENSGQIDSLIGNLNRFSAQLTDEQIVARLGSAVDELTTLLASIEHGDGTMARIVNDPALYESVNGAVENLSALLADMKQYPGRYVHLSVFGRNPEKMKAKADRKAAKAAEKARRDSLEQAEKQNR
ncbi:MAG: MlaD family protein [Alistipes senegalensis]|nr:MlaD family protein [Bacteroides cellulosilyticus]MCM1351543.1 MlaD family protein [Alistipes senegalensis]